MSRYERIECWTCSGHGVVDRSYHDPGECPTCGGSGHVIRYASGVLAKYPGGPYLGRDHTIASASPADQQGGGK